MDCLAAIVACLVPNDPPLDPQARAVVVRDVTRFVRAQVQRAPAHIGAAARVGGWLLGTWLAIRLHRTVRAEQPVRQAEAAAAGFSRLPAPCPAILRLYRSLVMLAFYEHPVVSSAMGFEEPGARMGRYRARRSELVAQAARR